MFSADDIPDNFTLALVETITAPAPVVTQLAVEYYDTTDQCPPAYTPAFLCPEGTADALDSSDPAYDPNYLTCPVLAQDGFGGS